MLVFLCWKLLVSHVCMACLLDRLTVGFCPQNGLWKCFFFSSGTKLILTSGHSILKKFLNAIILTVPSL